MIATLLPPPRSFTRALFILLMKICVIFWVGTAIGWIITGEISVFGLQMLVAGFGACVFGACGLVSDALGRRRSSIWSRVGVLGAIVGAVLFVVAVFGFFVLPAVWKTIGACFFIAFAGVRGSLVHAVDTTVAGGLLDDGRARFMRRLALMSIGLTMGLGIGLSTVGLSPLAFKVFGVAALLESGAVLMLLALRAEQPRTTFAADDVRTDSTVDSNDSTTDA